MLKKLCFVVSGLFMAGVLLAACGADATPAAAPAVTSTVLPTAALPDGSSLMVGLVTDVGGVNDQGFNQLAWAGVQKAAADMGFQAKVAAAGQPAGYEQNIDELAAAGYDVIIAAGPLLADATAAKARQYPTIRFAIVDHAYVPTEGSPACGGTVHDCYADGGLANVTSLMFAEEQAGFLAGVLAGGLSRAGFVCSVASEQTPAIERYVRSFFAGAAWQAGEELKYLNQFMPSAADPAQGKETALGLIGMGCDVVLGVHADGALLAAKEHNLPAFGVDVDQHNTDPAVKDVLVSSALKKVDAAVYAYLRAVADGSVKGGISTATLETGGVGLAPFHDWDGRIPGDLKAQVQKASEGIKDGAIKIDLP
jgi:basic membrane lipoprotein Med (substrate-binding protein (PBP1-ABC) superfamily)